jgi:hypothetical protein
MTFRNAGGYSYSEVIHYTADIKMVARSAAFAAIAAVFVGCGGSEKVVPVSGVVKLDGKPLANAYVSFQPTAATGSSKAGIGSYGVTDASGKYSLKTADNDQSGAVVGPHRVEIDLKQAETDDRDPKLRPPPKHLPPKYNRNSELEFKVPAGGTTAANFELKSQ